MPPIDEADRAILELACRRGLSYAEIDAALDGRPGEARERGFAALAALGEGSPPPQLADYLLGRCDTAERARVRDWLAGDRAARRQAARLAARLRAEVPGAKVPEVPAAPRGDARRRLATRDERSHDPAHLDDAPDPSLDRHPRGKARSAAARLPRVRRPARSVTPPGTRGRGIAYLAAAALAIGAGVGAAIIVTGDDEPSPQPAGEKVEEPPPPVRVRLEATPESGDARGEAVVGLDDRFEPYLDLDLEGLPPLAAGEIYIPWIDIASGRGLPVPTLIPVAEDGSFTGRLDLAIPLISVLDVARSFQVLPIGRAGLAGINRDLQRIGSGAGDGGAVLATRSPGGAVLSGAIPVR